MDTLLLLSVIGFSVFLPMAAADQADPRRALRRCSLMFLGFNVFYIAALLYLYPRLL